MSRPLRPAPAAPPPSGDVARFLKMLLVGVAANGLAWGAIVAVRPRPLRTAGAMPVPYVGPPQEGPQPPAQEAAPPPADDE